MEKSLKFLVTITNVMAPQTSFSPDQVVWIIFKYGEVKNVRLVQAAFRREFYSINYRKMPDISSFRRVIQRFEISGGNAQPKKRQGKGIPDDDIKQVHDLNPRMMHTSEMQAEILVFLSRRYGSF